MNHHKRTRSFGLSKTQRAALLRSLARSLVSKSKITTTEAKAKELRPFVERIVTKAKTDTLASRRYIIERLGSETGASKLLKEVAPKYADRNGGYTRIVKLPQRKSDGSPMAIIEFV
jgi:large subunit ribosomal protein L17